MTTIGGGRGMGRRPAAAMPQAEDEDSLYFIVRTGRVSLQQTVDDWIEEYKVRISGHHTIGGQNDDLRPLTYTPVTS